MKPEKIKFDPFKLAQLANDILVAADAFAENILDSEDPQPLILAVLDAANLKRAYIADHQRKVK